MTLLLFRVIDQRQIRAQARSEFSCFDQHRLQMLVPLFRDGHALDRLRRASLSTAQTAVTHSLLDRVKANYIVDFKHPGQRGDRPDRRIVIRRSTRACSSGSRRNERTLNPRAFRGTNPSPEPQPDPNERIGLSSTVENKQIAEELPRYSLFAA